jgi:hypothetical protein
MLSTKRYYLGQLKKLQVGWPVQKRITRAVTLLSLSTTYAATASPRDGRARRDDALLHTGVLVNRHLNRVG